MLTSSQVSCILVLFFPTFTSTSGDTLLNNGLDLDECGLIGLNRETLQCTYCDILQKFDLDDLQGSCKQCCNPALVDKSEDSEGPSTKFHKARLEVCWCKFPSMPQIEAFVKTEEKQRRFKNLELKHIQYQNPIIKLFNADGDVVQTLAINKWTTDTIVEFLASHLENNDHTEEL